MKARISSAVISSSKLMCRHSSVRGVTLLLEDPHTVRLSLISKPLNLDVMWQAAALALDPLHQSCLSHQLDTYHILNDLSIFLSLLRIKSSML